jgi:hypothetical protein
VLLSDQRRRGRGKTRKSEQRVRDTLVRVAVIVFACDLTIFQQYLSRLAASYLPVKPTV